MQKIYHLSTCDTCKRIIKDLEVPSSFVLQDIKRDQVTAGQLEEMHALSGSYESLFSRRAKLYKEQNLKDKKLTERDFKNLILEHYTFLKRPVILNNKEIFIGNTKNIILAAKQSIKN
jgi:arsenate reductase